MFNKIIVNDCLNNDTIYTYIKRQGISENYVRNLRKKEGYIKLNGGIAFTNAPIKNGDEIDTAYMRAKNIFDAIEIDTQEDN